MTVVVIMGLLAPLSHYLTVELTLTGKSNWASMTILAGSSGRLGRRVATSRFDTSKSDGRGDPDYAPTEFTHVVKVAPVGTTFPLTMRKEAGNAW